MFNICENTQGKLQVSKLNARYLILSTQPINSLTKVTTSENHSALCFMSLDLTVLRTQSRCTARKLLEWLIIGIMNSFQSAYTAFVNDSISKISVVPLLVTQLQLLKSIVFFELLKNNKYASTSLIVREKGSQFCLWHFLEKDTPRNVILYAVTARKRPSNSFANRWAVINKISSVVLRWCCRGKDPPSRNLLLKELPKGEDHNSISNWGLIISEIWVGTFTFCMHL